METMMSIEPAHAVEIIRRDILGKCEALGCKPEEYEAWHIADLIERQERQIERMRAALVEARRMAVESADGFKEYANLAGGDPSSGLAEYDALLRQIDEAMGGNDAQG